jgi:hypothetical protein
MIGINSTQRDRTRRRLNDGLRARVQVRGCTVCSERDRRLELHHYKPGRRASVFTIILNAGAERLFDRVLAEARLCVILCPSCHRRAHYPKRDEESC